jgi:hypothetical protein
MDVENHEHRRLIFINMKQILTPEEKQYLRRTANYLGSLGMRNGYINIEMDQDEDQINSKAIDWRYVTKFENNYNADIPEGLIPILKKVLEYADSLDNLNNDIENISHQRIEINIDGWNKEISVRHELYYYGRSDNHSIEYDSNEDKERFDKWIDEDLKDVEVPSDGILVLPYNGGGDSGYIENSFNPTGDEVPAGIEDWCYQQLESHFGGWEINEGSDGAFVFNFNNSTVTLDHVYNTEENEIDTLYEESFAK